MTLDNLVGKELREEPTAPEEIQRLLHKASTRLNDAKSEAISRESRFDLAYEAILQLAISALRANGYRPDSRGRHHVIALQNLTKTEISALLETGEDLKNHLKDWLRTNKPELMES